MYQMEWEAYFLPTYIIAYYEDFVTLREGPEPRPIFQSSWLLSSHTSGSPSWPTPPPNREVLNIYCAH